MGMGIQALFLCVLGPVDRRKEQMWPSAQEYLSMRMVLVARSLWKVVAVFPREMLISTVAKGMGKQEVQCLWLLAPIQLVVKEDQWLYRVVLYSPVDLLC